MFCLVCLCIAVLRFFCSCCVSCGVCVSFDVVWLLFVVCLDTAMVRACFCCRCVGFVWLSGLCIVVFGSRAVFRLF